MKLFERNPAIRQGQFLWMEKDAQSDYLTCLKGRIASGFYYSEQVIGKIVEELAPAFNDDADRAT